MPCASGEREAAPEFGAGATLRRFGKPIKVLIVEDEPLTALDFSLMIEDSGGHVVGTASSAAGAATLARSVAPDVVLMDVRLIGDGDGIDAARAIRAFSDVPIIFVTGNTDPSTAARIRAFGSSPVPKPVVQETLVLAVARAMEGEAGGPG